MCMSAIAPIVIKTVVIKIRDFLGDQLANSDVLISCVLEVDALESHAHFARYRAGLEKL